MKYVVVVVDVVSGTASGKGYAVVPTRRDTPILTERTKSTEIRPHFTFLLLYMPNTSLEIDEHIVLILSLINQNLDSLLLLSSS